ncbi:MAG TPA: DUF1553 domain-containing protein [Flavitalea sp.]|nr:DUF1553 domain-containing protein [Flavitalea sp.]
MAFVLSRKVLMLVICAAALILILFVTSGRRPIDYNTQVKPIINAKCITCHGGVKQKAGFSLLFRSDALAPNESGKPAIIPGDPSHSEMIRRITNSNEDERMPYKHPPLSENEISILKQWIKEGAVWGDHWSYIPLKEIPVPKEKSFSGFKGKNDWSVNEIDRFILHDLKAFDLTPSAEADKPTLLRRVSLDLTGLPPTPSLAKSFLSDTSSSAYEKLVDTLLSSPRFGERWAAMWLDLARYADTKGYERDDSRTIWHYRDYLIRSFNADKPYNQFLIEQLAGDLLKDPTDEQLIATAFHRNTMTNDEGGTDNEEFRTAAVVDRVNTTWETLMGTTFACVQCHSHPFDPFRNEEYYKFLAFFNNSRDEDTYDDYPLLRHFNKDDSSKLMELEKWMHTTVSSEKAKEITRFIKTWQPAINSLRADQFIQSELDDTKWLKFRNHGSARLAAINLDKKNLLITRFYSNIKNGTLVIHLDKADGPVLVKINVPETKGWEILQFIFPATSGTHDLYFTYTNPDLKLPDASGMTFDWMYFTEKFPAEGSIGYDKAVQSFWELVRSKTSDVTPVMMENPDDQHRKTYVFERGSWMTKGKEVMPGVPASLNAFPKNAPLNRLGLSLWMTSPDNPLTARTMVNRVWEQIFGNGLVETLEDLGTQGAVPTHKELLDWLSWEYIHTHKWSTKKLLKQIVLSATYRQDSRTNEHLMEKDPYNKYFARGPRVRLAGEQIRDQALSVSQLLNDRLYGPSVMPYQPGGIWLSPYSGLDWKESTAGDQYRRSLYTYWKRTAPYPTMITFDGGAREVCVARRIRTNTPLQALVTLNDEGFIQMARSLAKNMKRAGPDIISQINYGYQSIVFKPIPREKLNILTKLYTSALQQYKTDPVKTCEMTGLMDENNNPETAALVVVANALLNLDEVITKN